VQGIYSAKTGNTVGHTFILRVQSSNISVRNHKAGEDEKQIHEEPGILNDRNIQKTMCPSRVENQNHKRSYSSQPLKTYKESSITRITQDEFPETFINNKTLARFA
jgi:hypothetical protein